MPEGCYKYSVEYEAAAHRGVMPRREPVGDLGRPASLAARGGWACAAGGRLRGPSASSGCSLPVSYSIGYYSIVFLFFFDFFDFESL